MTCPTCAQPMMAVQYRLTPCDYDGTSEYACDQCALRVGRWSGLTLGEGELESRWGVDSPHKIGVESTVEQEAKKGANSKEAPQTEPMIFGEDLDD